MPKKWNSSKKNGGGFFGPNTCNYNEDTGEYVKGDRAKCPPSMNSSSSFTSSLSSGLQKGYDSARNAATGFASGLSNAASNLSSNFTTSRNNYNSPNYQQRYGGKGGFRASIDNSIASDAAPFNNSKTASPQAMVGGRTRKGARRRKSKKRSRKNSTKKRK